jgi:uncharacterized Zn finger protein
VDIAPGAPNAYRLAPRRAAQFPTMQTPPPSPSNRPPPGYVPKPVKPRKVRGGIKLASATGAYPESWAAQRWLRLVEQAAPGESMVKGLEYATLGQTRSIAMEPGWIRGVVQGTVITAYKTSIGIPTLTHDQAEKVISAMVDQAVYAAKLLAGELPANIEDVFAPLGLRLFPVEPAELSTKCSCREPQPWCKHACCLAYLVAERFTTDPFLIFTLRGLPREELLERLRQRRAVAAAGQGSVLVYSPLVPGVSDVQATPLEECVEGFWDAGPELAALNTPIQRPEVSHPLLRRLGPSPFGAGGGRFPLVGLLATCYEVISDAVLKDQEGEEPAPMGVDGGDDEGGPEEDSGT